MAQTAGITIKHTIFFLIFANAINAQSTLIDADNPEIQKNYAQFLKLPAIESDVVTGFDSVITAWTDFYQIQLSDFRLEGKLSVDLSIPDDASSLYYMEFDSLMCRENIPNLRDYSPDKSCYTDLLERSIIEKKEDGFWHYEGSDDCQEIRFVDCEKQLNKMISFRGMSSIADAIFWKDNDTFCIVSFESDECFRICIYDLKAKTETDYCYYPPEPLNVDRYYFLYNLQSKGVVTE